MNNDPNDISIWNLIIDFTSSDRMEDDMVRLDLLDPHECLTPILSSSSSSSTSSSPPPEDNDKVLDSDLDPTTMTILDEMLVVTDPISTDAIGQGYGFRNWTSTITVSWPENDDDHDEAILFDNLPNNTNTTSASVLTSTEDGHQIQFCVRIALVMPPSEDDDDNGFSERPVTQHGYLVTVVKTLYDEDNSSASSSNTTRMDGSIQPFPFPTFTLPPTPPPKPYAAFCDTNNIEQDIQPLIREGDSIRICIFLPRDEGEYTTTLGRIDFFQYEEMDRGEDEEEYSSTVNLTSTSSKEAEDVSPLAFQTAITSGGVGNLP